MIALQNSTAIGVTTYWYFIEHIDGHIITLNISKVFK